MMTPGPGMMTPGPEEGDMYAAHVAELLATLADMIDQPTERNRQIVAEMRLSVLAPLDRMEQEDREMKDSLHRFIKERKAQEIKRAYTPPSPAAPYDPLKGDLWVDTSYEYDTANADKYEMSETIRQAVSAEVEAKLVEQMRSYSQFVTWNPTKKNPEGSA